MKVCVVCVGKIKERYLADGIAEYCKRLGRFCTVEIAEVADERIPERPNGAEITRVLEAEAARMEKRIPKGAYVVGLCVEGRAMDSETFAKAMAQAQVQGFGTLAFLIGGSLGMAPRMKDMCHLRLSLSAMTLPHQLARLVLLEQIYRCYKINAGEEYHK